MNYTHVSPELKQRVIARIAECKQLSGIDVGPIDIRYDINSARLGGQAIYRGNVMRLNPVFLNAHTDLYIEDTVAHEFAHLAAVKKFGIAAHGHGNMWKHVMRTMKLNPRRCHNYSVPAGVAVGKQVQKYVTQCDRCGKEIPCGPKVHSKLQRGFVYKHARCGGTISVVGAAKPAPKPAVVKPVTLAKPPVITACRSKLEVCTDLYNKFKHLNDRQTMMAMFVNSAGCTPAGAATYYAKLKKEIG